MRDKIIGTILLMPMAFVLGYLVGSEPTIMAYMAGMVVLMVLTLIGCGYLSGEISE